jgi:hypothetical protein
MDTIATQTIENMASQTTNEVATQTIDKATLFRLALEYKIAHPIKFWGLERWQIGTILAAILLIWLTCEGTLWLTAKAFERFNSHKIRSLGRSCHHCRGRQHNTTVATMKNKKSEQWSEGRSYIDWESDSEDEVDNGTEIEQRDEYLNNGKRNSRIEAVFVGILQFLTWPYSCPCQRSCECWLSQETWYDGGEKVAERASDKVKDEEKGLLEEYGRQWPQC